ncbi:DUF5345 family protein [Paenibacillus sp. 1001270B_150601_E10]|uniref:DUF5345 family protein n=1 Tax=Paenibacillus sp. 1001270B_150601_E10 TaxID=2787079 RepID=UPI0018A068D6|nr:DUF5345 family protein [Paenibacillus sp. 1001270B_150601_E10]
MTKDSKHTKPVHVDDEKLAQKLSESWGTLDALAGHSPIPTKEDLLLMLSSHKKKMKRKLWKELGLLWGIAAFVIAGSLLLMERELSTYIWIQMLLAMGSVGYLSFQHWMTKARQRGESREHT